MSTYVEKFPEKSMAPPTFAREGRLMPVRAELLAIWAAPATFFKRGREMLASLELATKAMPPPFAP